MIDVLNNDLNIDISDWFCVIQEMQQLIIPPGYLAILKFDSRKKPQAVWRFQQSPQHQCHIWITAVFAGHARQTYLRYQGATIDNRRNRNH